MPGDPLRRNIRSSVSAITVTEKWEFYLPQLSRDLEMFILSSVIMNTLDAEARGIKDGDKVYIFNDRGNHSSPCQSHSAHCAGCLHYLRRGAWFKPETINGQVVDVGGCINTLTNHRPSSLAKSSNAQHNILVEIRKA